MENRIKYNLKNAHYALKKTGEDGASSYEKPVPLPGSVSITLDAQGEITKFYADGVIYYQSASNNGYDGNMELALIPESFKTDILGEKMDAKKVLVENSSENGKDFALLFEFEGDVKARRHVLYNCTSTRPSISGKTSEGKKEPQTETINISAAPDETGNVKATTTAETEKETYDKWFDEVYISAGGETA